MDIIGTYITDAKVYKNEKLVNLKKVNMIRFKSDGFVFDMQIKLCKPLNNK